MTIERIIRSFAGFIVLLSLALGVSASPLYHSVHWLWVTAFAGLNLFQSGFTNFCPPEKLLKRFGLNSTSS